MRRFPDDLPHRWGMRLPPHWRQGTGKRPVTPERETDLGRPGRPRPWFEESKGFGSESIRKRPTGSRLDRSRVASGLRVAGHRFTATAAFRTTPAAPRAANISDSGS
jgi:hypothetical protein